MIDTPATPAISAAKVELARTCRQICVRRELSTSAAAKIDEELEAALAEVRATFGADSVTYDDLVDIFQVESQRVADAVVLAEMIVPRLQSVLNRGTAPAVAEKSGAKTARRTDEKPKPAPAAARGLSIADMIDGMLDQERR